MIELAPLAAIIIAVVMLFYMIRSLIASVKNELETAMRAYKSDVAFISQQLAQFQESIETHVASISVELNKASNNCQRTSVVIIAQANETIESLREIKESFKRQQLLEAEIVRLKSILARKEKRHG